MVYDASLGYDPEEWEECPEPEHFLVFSFFTRFFLSAMAVSFAYFFFKMVEENKNKGNKKDEEEKAPVTEQLLQEVGQKLEKILVEQQDQPDSQQKYHILNAEQQRQNERNDQHILSQTTYNNLYEAPSSAEQLIREAEQYLRESPKKEASPRPFHYVAESSEQFTSPNNLKEHERAAGNAPTNIHQQQQQQQQQRQAQNVEDAFNSLMNQRSVEVGAQQHQNLAPLSPLDVQFMNLEQQAQLDQQPQQFSPQMKPEKKLSSEQQQAIYEWEMERERMENERIANLNQDRLVGGEESEFENSEQAIERLLPASHISYHSTSPEEPLLRDKRDMFVHQNLLQQQQLNPKLGEKLQQEINLIAGKADSAPNRDSFRDSELTDYDISDFHVHEPHYDHATAPAGDVQFVQAGSVQKGQRHETGDSDEYVKVEPIYDVPPGNEKVMTNEEARQLQELCREYDFGIDLGMPSVKGTSKDTQEPSAPLENVQAYPTQNFTSPFGVIGDRPVPQPRFTSAVIPSETSNDQATTVHIRLDGQNAAQDDTRNIVAAEMYIQDALEYLGNQNTANAVGGFVMEEDMLSSPPDSKRLSLHQQTKPMSGDPTSMMVKTMEVFERVEQDEHDDMTYAPEIQSVEIPPDQMSENSDNLQEYFDRVAAEGGIPAEIMKPLKDAQQVLQQNAVPQAPQILSAFANRKTASNSSLASGRSGRSHSGMSSDGYPRLRKQSSLLSVLGVTSMQEMLLTITSLDALSDAMRKAGLESTNIIFGIDYTASNKYQGEESFGGRSLHTIHPNIKNPYQQVITILGNTLAPFASTGRIPLFGFGDAKTGDWSTFSLKAGGDCTTLEEVLKVYNEITPSVELSGPTNFAPLIYQAMEICQKANDYHILVIIADGQVTNERATRRAIVQACQYPLSIIVVGVGDGPWDMMRVFDESLPKRSWDNFHFVEFHDIIKKTTGLEDGELKLAVQSLLEIPDQYRCICELGLLRNRPPPMRGSDIKKEMQTH